MTRCEEFYEKCERDGNFCGMERTSYVRVVAYIAFCKENNVPFGTLSDRAARKLITERDSEVREEAIRRVKESIKHGNIPTAKQVQTKIVNVRKGVKKGGRRPKGREDLDTDILIPLASGEVKHHITNVDIIGIPEEVHMRLSGQSREIHRKKVMQWLKQQKVKYEVALKTMEGEK